MSMQPGGLLPPLDPNGQQGPDTGRLLMTVVLVTVVWMAFQIWFPTTPAAAPGPTTTSTQVAAGAAGTTTGPAGAGATTSGAAELIAAPAGTPDALPEQKVSFDARVAASSGATSVAVKGGYTATVSSHGGQIVGFVLDGYDEHTGQTTEKSTPATPVDLARATHDGARLFALRSRGGDVQLAADAPYEILQQDGRSVVLSRLTSSGVRITRSYTFDPKRFAFVHELTLRNEGTVARAAQLDIVFVGEEKEGAKEGTMFSAPTDHLGGACRVDGKRHAFTAKDLAKEDADDRVFAGATSYAALDRHYFLASITADGSAPTASCRAQPFGPHDGEKAFDLVVENAPITLAPGETKTVRNEAYFGPKQLGLLHAFGHELDENIDFGMFGVLSRPMLWLLVQLHGQTGNFGIAIILLTLLVKLVTFPLTQKGYVGMQQMKKLQPELKALQDKFGHDRAVFGQKQMELFQKEGVNPLSGCFPMLIQMPIWFALYRTLSQSVELYQQPFVGTITDLTQPDVLLLGIPLLPIIVGGLMLFQTVMQPPPEDQPQMKYMMWGMPIFFTFLMMNMASGLSIYMITNSLLTMAQQYYIKRRYA